MQYSHIRPNNAVVYGFSLLFFAVIRMRNTLLSYIRVNINSFEESFEVDQDDFVYSAMVFNVWNFGINNKVDRESNIDATVNMSLTQLREDELKSKLGQRKKG
jgi:hypothetical protein